MNYEYNLLVDPQRLLLVRFVDDEGATQAVVALTCTYVVARSASGRAGVAIEVVVDPSTPHPAVAYYCPQQRLQRVLVPPGRVKVVSPYRQS